MSSRPPKQPVVHLTDPDTGSDDSVRELFRFPYNDTSDDESSTSGVPVNPSAGNAQQGEPGADSTSGAAQEGANSDAAIDIPDEDLPKLKYKYNEVYQRQGPGNKYHEAWISGPDDNKSEYMGSFKAVKTAKQPMVHLTDPDTSDDSSVRELFRFPYNDTSDDESSTSGVPVNPSAGNAQQGEPGADSTSGAAQEGANSECH